MNCKLIHLIFSKNRNPNCIFDRDAQLEAILGLGSTKQISVYFTRDICHHPDHSSQIYWREIPIVYLKCFGIQCNFEIINNTHNILSHVLQPVIQLPEVRYIGILLDIYLPRWNNSREIIIVLNRAGKLLLIPTETEIPQIDLVKIRRKWEFQSRKLIEEKNDLELIDLIAPKSFPKGEFRIFIQ